MDQIDIEILPDGTIKSTTTKFRAVNHQAAEAFMKELEKNAGTPAKRSRRGTAKAEGHQHHHQHQHN